MPDLNRSLSAACFALLISTVVPSFGEEWPFELLIDLETTGVPLLIPPPITAPPIELPGSNPTQLLVVDSRLYFTADDRTHGAELWTTDGTAGGTSPVADLCPGSCSASPILLGALDGDLVFWADDGEHGLEPWATDGTVAGTRRLADVCPGDCDGRSNYIFAWLREFAPREAAVAGGHLFFVARSPETGKELWLTDGTAGGTRQVADLCEGPCDGVVYSSGPLAAIDGRAVFQADDGTGGEKLWATDGETVWLVRDFCPGPDEHTGLWEMAMAGGRLVLASSCGFEDGKLWATDGTAEGTELLAELPDDEDGDAPWVWDLIPLERDRTLVRLQYFGSSTPNQLWITDGTAGGTGPVFDQLPDSFQSMRRYGERAALISSSTDAHGLWITDGRPGGTRRIDGLTVTGDVGSAGSWLLFYGIDDLGNEGLYALQGGDDPQLVSGLEVGSGVYVEALETAVLAGRLLIPAFADPEEGAELWFTPWQRLELRPTRAGEGPGGPSFGPRPGKLR